MCVGDRGMLRVGGGDAKSGKRGDAKGGEGDANPNPAPPGAT